MYNGAYTAFASNTYHLEETIMKKSTKVLVLVLALVLVAAAVCLVVMNRPGKQPELGCSNRIIGS